MTPQHYDAAVTAPAAMGRAMRRDRAPPPSVSRPRLHSPIRASCTRDEIACGSGSQREVWAHPDRDTNPAPMQSRGRTTRPSLASAAVTAGPTIGFVHTVLSLPPTFASLAEELVPDAEVFHIVDETLLGVTRKAGELTPTTRRRVLGYVESAAGAGADFVVVTCSSIGLAVDGSRSFVTVPVLRIDVPMADEAVGIGKRIGVVATLSTTLEPTAELVKRRAR